MFKVNGGLSFEIFANELPEISTARKLDIWDSKD